MENETTITFENFYLNTKALFKGCKIPKRKPNYISYNRWGEVSSRYWYGEDRLGQFVIRESNHWVNVKQKFSNVIECDCERIGTCNCNCNLVSTIIFDKQFVGGKCYPKNMNFM